MLNLRPKAARDDEPDLTPLIDMVFILLIFFILAASFAVRGIDLDLPPAHSGQALSGRVVEIRLLRDGSFLCEGIPVARADIRAKLQSLVRDFRARPGQLVLKAAPDAPVEALVFIVDEVRMQGGEKLLIATGRSRKAAQWQNREMLWSEVLDKLANTTRTRETVNPSRPSPPLSRWTWRPRQWQRAGRRASA